MAETEATRADLRPLPDFVIAGAPGAGTTFAYESLRQHPGVYMPIRKELHHFCPDLDSGSEVDGRFFVRSAAEYRSFFTDARADQKVGEASPWYLYSVEAPARLLRANPDVRVVVMVRDPVEVVRYVHSRRVQFGNEDLESLEDALAAEPDRRGGNRIPRGAWNLPGLQYRDHGRYSAHLGRYLSTVPREQVLLVLFDDLVADPAGAYRQLARHLGIDTKFEPRLRRTNRREAVRSRSLQGLLRSPAIAGPVRRLAPRALHERLRTLARRVNSRPLEQGEMPPALRARLRAEFRHEVEWLSVVLERDLMRLWAD